MTQLYRFKPQSRLTGDAQRVGETIEALRTERERGTVSPRAIVEAARPAKSALHGYFEWNDKRAGEAFREHQAAHLLRSLVTTHRAADGEERITRAYVSIARAGDANEEEPAEGGGTYVSIADAVQIVDYRAQLIRNALRDLDAYRLKYQLLADLTGWGKAIARARAELQDQVEALSAKRADDMEAAVAQESAQRPAVPMAAAPE